MKISSKLLILFLVISLIPLSVLSYIQYITAEKEILDQIYSRLSTASLLLESQVNSEIEKHLLLRDLFTSRVLLRTSLENYNQNGDEESKNNIQKIISEAHISNPQVDSIFILNDKEVVALVKEHQITDNSFDTEFLFNQQVANNIEFITTDTKNENHMHIRLMGKLINEEKERIGTVILDFNSGKIFLGTQELGLGNSGEYVIAVKREDGNSRIIAPFNTSKNGEPIVIPSGQVDLPVTQALMRNEKLFNGVVDYNGNSVIAVTKYLEPFDLGLVIKIDREEALSSISQLRTFNLVLSSFTIFLSIIFAIFFSRSISEPISKIRIATKQIISGKFTDKLEIKGSDEIQHLSEDINDMASELEMQKNHLIASERFSAIGELSARIAHDLKNPLNNLSMAVEIIQKKNINQFDKEDLEKIKIMKKSISRMNRQINGVLDFVRKTPLSKQKHSLRELLQSALSTIEIPTNVKIKIPEKDYLINCDPRLETVFMNLFNNALDSLGKNGEINVEIIDNENEIILNFIDTGKGFEKDVLSKIFEPLFTTKEHGTGLGLVTCKSIVEQHGGIISAKNNPTTFTIKLPKS